jgi:hypothetical protein
MLSQSAAPDYGKFGNQIAESLDPMQSVHLPAWRGPFRPALPARLGSCPFDDGGPELSG